MEAFLHSLGRVVVYDSCYQVLDVVALDYQQLRTLNNWPHEIRRSDISLTGYELVVYRSQPAAAAPFIGTAVALALALVLL